MKMKKLNEKQMANVIGGEDTTSIPDIDGRKYPQG
jgi:bacteriocin-like protein